MAGGTLDNRLMGNLLGIGCHGFRMPEIVVKQIIQICVIKGIPGVFLNFIEH